jgi:Flp pilus assembly protein TadG
MEHRSSSGRQAGQVLPMFAIFATVLMLMLAIVIDLGYGFTQRRETQNGADFAALAGTRVIVQSLKGASRTQHDVAAAITDAATRNGTSVTFGTPLGPVYTDANGVDLAGPAYVADSAAAIPAGARGVDVRASRTWRAYLASLMGNSTMTATSQAVARATLGSRPACAFCVVGSTTMDPQSGSQVNVTNGAIALNASQVNMQSGSMLTSDQSLSYLGGMNVCGNCTASTPRIHLGAPVPDPFASLPDAYNPTGGNPAEAKQQNVPPTIINPGVYSTLTLSANGTMQLTPGTYYITDKLDCQKGVFDATAGVTLVFAQQSTMTLQANCDFKLTAPSASLAATPGPGGYFQTPFPGLAIYFVRTNTQGKLELQSSSTGVINGAVYALGADWDSQSGTQVGTVNGMVVVGSAKSMQSNSVLNVSYDDSLNRYFVGTAALVK